MLIQNPKNSHVRTYSLYRASVTMRSLEILTQRIFNNLIKQNQKLESDSVLKQSATSVSRVQRPDSSVRLQGSRVQHPGSSVQRLASSVQHPEPSVQRPESRVQSPASNTCFQSPGIPVCRNFLVHSFSEQVAAKGNS